MFLIIFVNKSELANSLLQMDESLYYLSLT